MSKYYCEDCICRQPNLASSGKREFQWPEDYECAAGYGEFPDYTECGLFILDAKERQHELGEEPNGV